MKQDFSDSWKNSTQRRKQRKYQYNAPLHIKQKMLKVHLSKELIEKYQKRSILVRKEDKVKILRGQFKGKSGKVEIVDLKRDNVQVSGIELIKKDGSKVPVKIHPSNLVITELFLDDKKRKEKLQKENKSVKK